MSLLIRSFKIVTGISIVAVSFSGFVPLFMGSASVGSFTASTDEAFYEFNKYVNQESEQTQVHKERAKRLNEMKPNSFGIFGTLDEYETSAGVKYKKRF